MSRAVACLLAQAGSHLCAIPVADVVETMRPLPVERLPGMPAELLGLSFVRGAAVPVVDLARVLAEGGDAHAISRYVLVRGRDRRFALAVAAVPGIDALDDAELDAGAALAAEIAAPCVAAITRRGARSLVVLDVARLLPGRLEGGDD